jgi:alpha-mannosidase
MHNLGVQRTLFDSFILERVRKLSRRLQSDLWVKKQPASVAVGYEEQDDHNGSLHPDPQKLIYQPISPGAPFAKAGWNFVWFKVEWRDEAAENGSADEGAGASHFLWRCNGESTLYVNGIPWCGLDTAHRSTPLPPGAKTLFIRTGAYETGIWMKAPEDQYPKPTDDSYVFYSAEIGQQDPQLKRLYHDVLLVYEYLHHELEALHLISPEVGKHKLLEFVPPRLRKMLQVADEAVDAYDLGDVTGCQDMLAVMVTDSASVSHTENGSLGPGNAFGPGSISLISNSHLDLVWLWPEQITREKNVHTCTTILRLMERYPELTFTMSQPYLLEQIKRDHYPVYREISKRIQEGRWELTGGMYVESDTLLPSGESLLRACLLGQELILEETGSLCSTLWLPDVFGYSQSIPQIAVSCGITSFFTTKLLWSSMNTFPCTSFIWEGLDGSRLVSHVAQVGYESRGSVGEITRTAWGNRQAALFDDAILAVGFGDGGGGITEDQCERVNRLAQFADLPSAGWQRVDAFFERLGQQEQSLPIYKGELYLEYHRGTYTTNHAVKQAYRQAEQALQAAESIAVLTGYDTDFTHQWKRLVFSQFHDALPGSSIRLVYDQLIPELQALANDTAEQAKELLRQFFTDIGADGGTASMESTGLLLANPHGLSGSWLISLETDQLGSEAISLPDDTGNISISEASEYIGIPEVCGATFPVQKLSSGGYVGLVRLPGNSVSAAYPVAFSDVPDIRQRERSTEPEFSPQGLLIGLTIDGKKLQLEGPVRFLLYPDNPANFEAWDIDRSALNLGFPAFEAMNLISTDDGPLVTLNTGSTPIGKGSTLTVTYRTVRELPYLFIDVTVDWQEEQRLLALEIPTGYRGAAARFGSPFGSIDRPAHSGSLQKEAMWEEPASRWVAVLDGMHRGMALLSADTYGFAVTDGVLRASLLRSPKSSDEQGIQNFTLFAEKGIHSFSFALGWYRAETADAYLSTAQAADMLFSPPLVVSNVYFPESGASEFLAGGDRQDDGVLEQLFSCSNLGSLTVSWIKPAHTGSGYLIRFHETAGCSGIVRLDFGHDNRVSKVYLVDALERIKEEIPVENAMAAIPYHPYQLLSVLAVRKFTVADTSIK